LHSSDHLLDSSTETSQPDSRAIGAVAMGAVAINNGHRLRDVRLQISIVDAMRLLIRF